MHSFFEKNSRHRTAVLFFSFYFFAAPQKSSGAAELLEYNRMILPVSAITVAVAEKRVHALFQNFDVQFFIEFYTRDDRGDFFVAKAA